MFDIMSSVTTNANDPHSVQQPKSIPQDRACIMLEKTKTMLEEILCKANGISSTIRGVYKVPDGDTSSPECMMDVIKGNMELIDRIDEILGGILEVL